ncbi:DUF2303 family protein [Burkholderia multivorans]|uniref:DUF2303 family protein n=1 Tax=Burkholderia multivorans TaxID=87883 RepID=UPI001C212CC0|nr:DUF2303 family protein [Burkholderia multivorans]MBU9386597.1 YfdQ family protein [Burkholderia multivorans]MBU9437030.1 YfdQ family protein [Burkholderia multivorans]MBU9606237.1 YfdQ family protein [Burkholderia multivorans]MBU9624796.1 YfdQ family protein [Burkholderia multivorans]MDN7510940.1 DUF2303 family protein [Burkholderia multivorans]
MEQTNDFVAARDAGAALAEIRNVGGTPIAIVPDGYRVEQLEHLLGVPARHRGSAELLDAASFIAYVNKFKDAGGTTRIYFRTDPKPQFVAVLNDSTADAPAWADFRATYNAPLSKEWVTWTGSDQKPMSQDEFALFIERNLPDVNVPPAAEMLEIATTLQAKKGVEFASGTRLVNGQVQFVFKETIQARAGEKGQFNVPEQIEIVIPVFEGSAVGDRLIAKFRYRIQDANLRMWYELDRPHKVLDAAVGDLRKEIEEGTGLVAFKGVPA